MKAIELTSKTDKAGNLRIDYQLDKSESNVRILILLDEDSEDHEADLWLKSALKSPAFDFLNEEEEIYSVKDGEPIS